MEDIKNYENHLILKKILNLCIYVCFSLGHALEYKNKEMYQLYVRFYPMINQYNE